MRRTTRDGGNGVVMVFGHGLGKKISLVVSHETRAQLRFCLVGLPGSEPLRPARFCQAGQPRDAPRNHVTQGPHIWTYGEYGTDFYSAVLLGTISGRGCADSESIKWGMENAASERSHGRYIYGRCSIPPSQSQGSSPASITVSPLTK